MMHVLLRFKKKKKEPDRISKLLSILVENIRIKFGFVFN